MTLGVEVSFEAVYSPASLNHHKKTTKETLNILLDRIADDFQIADASNVMFIDCNPEVLRVATSLGCMTTLINTKQNQSLPTDRKTSINLVIPDIYHLDQVSLYMQSTDMDNEKK